MQILKCLTSLQNSVFQLHSVECDSESWFPKHFEGYAEKHMNNRKYEIQSNTNLFSIHDEAGSC